MRSESPDCCSSFSPGPEAGCLNIFQAALCPATNARKYFLDQMGSDEREFESNTAPADPCHVSGRFKHAAKIF